MADSRFAGRFLARPFSVLTMLVLLSVLIASLVVAQNSRLLRERSWLTHTYIVLNMIDELVLKLSEAESSQRLYLLSRSDTALAEFQTMIGDAKAGSESGSIEGRLEKLRLLTTDNPSQQERIVHLEKTVHEKVGFMRDIVAYAPGRSNEEVKLYARNRGIDLMAEIRTIVQDMENEENRLLKARTGQEEQIAQWIMYTSLGFGILLVGILGLGLSAIQRELVRRRQAEKALHASNAFQDALLQSTPYAVIAYDPMGIVKMFNPAAEAMLGYTSAEVVGRERPSLFHDPAEVALRAGELSAELNRPIAPDFTVLTTMPSLFGPEQREWTYRRKDGTTLPVQLIITAVPDGEGGIAGYFGIAEDITERKRVEQMKNEFISTVSHELRTPLTSIRGALSLVLAGVTGTIADKAKDLIAIAFNNTERLVRLINDILDIEKIESGNIVVDLGPIPIGPLLEQVVRENLPFAAKFQVTLKIEDETGDASVQASQDHLLQVLTNLLSNAVKFSTPGDTVIMAAGLQDERVWFRVIDNGPGIPVEFQPRIFQKFSQADSSATRAISGTGLGLSISKALMEKMNGTVTFESEPGHTVFSLDLPKAVSPLGTIDPAPSVRPAGNRVLVVEDDPDIAHLLQIMLQQEKLNCAIAGSAAEAKRMLKQESFMAMTLDLELPDQNGLSLIRDLRADPETLDLPVVVISIRAEEGRKIMKGHAVGIVDWLQKPIDIARLQHVLRNLVSLAPLPSVIHVEDDSDMVGVIALSLVGQATITHAPTLAIAQYKLGSQSFDLAILDIKLPDGSGLDLLPVLAAHEPTIPVIILSASETSKELQKSVQAALVKSVISEEKIVDTIQRAIANSVGDTRS